jgi:UDP-glucuronate 4-epimerase
LISSTTIYKPPANPADLCDERTSVLGYHPAFAPSYSMIKVATEATVRTLARVFKIPSIIARLGVAYGGSGHGGVPTIALKSMLAGEPVRIANEGLFSMIHEDDLLDALEPLLKAAAIPATITNWASDELVKERELYEYIAQIAGIEANLVIAGGGFAEGAVGNPAFRRTLTGPSKVSWKTGVLDSLCRNFPDHQFRESA